MGVKEVSVADDALLRELDAGRVRGAAELLVRDHAAAVLDLCSAMVRDRQRAEDLTQDVFGKAFTALPAFRGEAAVRTWVLRIARNHCIDHLRRCRIEPWPDGEAGEATEDSSPLPHELLSSRADVQRALSCLGEGERALVVLRFRNGLDYAELAEAFGLKQGTVRMRISRALAKMRAELESPVAGAALGVLAAPAAAPPEPQSRALLPPRFKGLARAAGAPKSRAWPTPVGDGLRRALAGALPAPSAELLGALRARARSLL